MNRKFMTLSIFRFFRWMYFLRSRSTLRSETISDNWKRFKKWKALFFFKIFAFLFWLFGHVGKRLMIRKLSLISKFVTSQSGLQIIIIHILPNTSRKKGNQTMKFDQLIKYNVKNIFFPEIMQKMGHGH